MTNPVPFKIFAMATLIWLVAAPAEAAVYKCFDGNGQVIFSQTPCPNQASDDVHAETRQASDNVADCADAERFALHVANDMRRGKRSADVFDSYGGFSALSKGSINVVNYVFAFKHSDDTSAERIAALARAKCAARSFGDVSCETLPLAYTTSIGGCDDDSDEALAAQAIEADGSEMTTMAMSQPASHVLSAGGDSPAACKARVQSQIDRVNASMRGGYTSEQGEKYRQQLRALRTQMHGC